jgi:hypothetical protein
MYSCKEQSLIYQWDSKYPSWEIYWQGFRSNKTLLISANPQNAASNGHLIVLHKGSKEVVRLQVNRLGRIVD